MSQRTRPPQRSEPYDVAAGFWWRCSAYELREGFIRPVARATVERYDPWEAYRGRWQAGPAPASPPYQGLLNLVADLPADLPRPGRHERLSPSTATAIAAWCQAHGLLGVLLQQSRQVILAPRWEPPGARPDREVRSDGGVLGLAQWRYVRGNLGWTSRRAWALKAGVQGGREDPRAPGRLVQPRAWPKGFQPPSALIQRLDEHPEAGDWVQEPLPVTWGQFFPRVPASERSAFRYPRPLSDAFCRLYAEPVDEFIGAARRFREALDGLARAKPWSEPPDQDLLRMAQGRDWLNTLLNGVSPALLLRRDGKGESRWVAPSLLASFAMMALQDVTEGRRLLRCANPTCGRLFVTGAWQGRYCLSRCRNAVQKRAYRAKETAMVRI